MLEVDVGRRRRALAWLWLCKVLVGLAVWLSGFRAISDDDFARVVLMQRWAAQPQLDPTHTSWLPAPFWLGGGWMSLFGSSLLAARVLALASGCVAVWLLYRAAHALVGPRDAFAGAFLAAVLPWSAYLGVATVPELLTFALCVFALACVVPGEGRAPSLTWGGLALLAACLSRYEAWILAGCFVALMVKRRRKAPLALLLAVLGPLSWIAYNAYEHGAALHFAERVSAYSHALRGQQAVWRAWLHYPLLLLRQEPELWLAALGLGLTQRRWGWTWPRGLGWLAAICGLLLAALSWAAGRGGAATHHAGRSILFVWLVAAIYVGAAARRGLVSRQPGRAWLAAALVGCVALGGLVLRPWYGRFEHFARREGLAQFGALAAGATLRSEQTAGSARVLLDASDYGYFAIQAGSGVPAAWRVDRSMDPRTKQPASSFRSCRALQQRLNEMATHPPRPLFGATNRQAAARWLGPALVEHAGWSLYRLPAAIGAPPGGLCAAAEPQSPR